MARSTRPVALVTGAAHGIGRAITVHLANSGWNVGAVDLATTVLATTFRRYARNVLPIAGDVSQEPAASHAVEAIVERWGRLDGLVSNAGIMIRKPIRQLSFADWNRVLGTNLSAAFLFARAAEKALRQAKGAIVNIASTRAIMSEPDTEAYAATKGGLFALSHALAISLGPDVRVNCVSPGWIQTTDYNKLRRKDHAQHPVGRVGTPQDIAEIVAWLLDGERSGFVTGANFIVDGGMTRKMIYEE
jgi:NAD(P)-dependent dehydrogenase (short-subunit alcohol dehydrogenase family)